MGWRPLVGVILVLVLVTASVSAAQAISPTPSTTWIANGQVASAVASGQTVYLAGSFDRIGPKTGSLVAIDSLTGEPILGRMPRVVGSISALIGDGSGGYFIAGDFTRIGAATAQSLAHLTASGALDTTFRSPPGFDMATDVILVGGRLFAALASRAVLARATIVELDPSTGAVRSSSASITTALPRLFPLGSAMLVAGGGELIALDVLTWQQRWRTEAQRVAVEGTTIFVSSNLQVSRVDPDTGARTMFIEALQVPLYCGKVPCTFASMRLSQGRLYLTGPMAAIGGQARHNGAAVDAVTGAVLDWTLPDAPDRSIPVILNRDGNRLLLVYGFSGTLLRAADPDSGALSEWRAYFLGGGVQASLSESNQLLIAGSFAGAGGVERIGLAAVHWPDGSPTAWKATALTSATAFWMAKLAIKDGRLFVATWSDLLEFDTVIGARVASVPLWPGGGASLLLSGNRLFVGGGFSHADNQPRPLLASFDIAATPLLEDWAPQLDGEPLSSTVRSISVLPSGVYFSGKFIGISGQPRLGTGAVDATNATPLEWSLPAANLLLQATSDRLWVSGGPANWGSPPSGGQAALDLRGRLLPWRAATPPPALVRAATAARADVDQRGVVFGDRMYVFLGYALDLATGAATDWSPDLEENAVFGSEWAGVGDLGLVRLLSTRTGFAFYPRVVPGIAAVTNAQASASRNAWQLTWTAAAGAISYVIEAGSVSGFADVATLDTRSPATTFAGSAPDGAYYVRVRARTAQGDGPPSNELRLVLGPRACTAAPGPPLSLSASRSGNVVTLQWLPPDRGGPVDGYVVRVGLSAGATVLRVPVGATPRLSGAAPPGTYFARVLATNGCGSSGASNEVTIVVP